MRRSPVRPLHPGLLAGGLFALVAAAWSPVRAEVPPVDDAGARALAATLKSGLTRWFPPAAEDGEGLGFEWEGEPTVKPAGDHYDVALPRLSAEDSEGTRIEFGTVLLTVTPRDAGLFGIAVTMPSKIAVQHLDEEEEDYAEVANLTLGRQSFTGTWSAPLENLLTVDAAYNDLTVTAAGDAGKVTIGSLTLVQDLKPDGATTFSGPVALAIGAVAATNDKKQEMFKLAGLAVENSYVRADLAKIGALQKLSQKYSAAGKTPTAQEILPMLHGLIGGFSGKVRLTGLSVLGGGETPNVSLGQMSFQGGVEDLDQALSTVRFGMEARDFAMTPSMTPPAFTPTAMNLELSAAKLPNAALWQTFSDLIVAAEAEEKAKEAKEAKPAAKDKKAKTPPPPPAPSAADVAMQKTMAALIEAGTELRLDSMKVDTPATAGNATGALRVAANAPQGVTGGAVILLRGLDAAVKAMQPAPGTQPDPDTQNMLGMVGMLQALGQVSKDDTGAEIRSYKIDMTETGQLLLNGADMAPLLAAGNPPPPAAEPPKKKK
ncbi:hypothetical protein [Azospirillum doebereinerae]|uniref:DUF945 domain-containing protein n=1 Tax=Azospirillum doebereinerae TaxID=92933 RepID=A0A3S0V3P3_9PROT|nr:hypothetical protein [Azospirillum doebereinerae]RUQ65929.1 hypothetical protein EJ913_24985 [Azospirillum doebereinerae]